MGSAPPPPRVVPPQRDCGGGWYGLQEPWDFAGYLPTRHFGCYDQLSAVIGVVAGWGRTCRGKRGWRVQFAKPVALYRSPHLGEQLDRIARRDGCQVVQGRSELLAVAEQHA